MAAAQACHNANMPWADKLLQRIADAVQDGGDESAIYWLNAVRHMCEAIWQERFDRSTGEELKLVLSIVQPKAFMPVHGEATHLRAHARLAEATGVPTDNVFICENGESLELTSQGVVRGETVQSGIVFVDGLSVGDTSQGVLDERNALGSQGFAAIAAAVSPKGKNVVGNVQIEMHGITGGDDDFLVREAQGTVKNALGRAMGKGGGQKEWKKAGRDALLSLLWERTKTRPMVIVNLLEV